MDHSKLCVLYGNPKRNIWGTIMMASAILYFIVEANNEKAILRPHQWFYFYGNLFFASGTLKSAWTLLQFCPGSKWKVPFCITSPRLPYPIWAIPLWAISDTVISYNILWPYLSLRWVNHWIIQHYEISQALTFTWRTN